MKLLDGIFAAMPDQTQSSPELFDAEEKLDELLMFTELGRQKNQSKGINAITPDMVFDIYSEVDATTSASWHHPILNKRKRGKIEWLFKHIGVLD